MDFTIVLPFIYINFDIQTNSEVNETQISHFIPQKSLKLPYLKAPFCPSVIHQRGRLQRTSGKCGGGGFEISDIPGRGTGVVCESSDVRKFLKKSKFQNFSELFKVKTRNYNRSIFQYESIHI